MVQSLVSLKFWDSVNNAMDILLFCFTHITLTD